MRRRTSDLALVGFLAAVSYLPLLLSKPGKIAADTKQYLYLDPGKLTVGAASMWDPNTGLGTVTHQNIGYLFPMGPYYTLVSWLGIPTWVGQRIWMGSLVFAAGMGVAYCARQMGLEGAGRWIAALAYALSPYTIDYLDRTSAILMPWAALGWMVGLTALAARTGRWRYPAGLAFVVALVGGVNATSIVLVLLGPAVWLAHSVWVSKEVRLRDALVAGARITVLCILVSLWWAAGLWAESKYGLNVLRVTETVPTVATTSSASEVLRGLGYWYFYGWDKVQPWTLPAVEYTQTLWLLAVSLILPGICILLGLLTRWRYRSFALSLIGMATAVAVGAFPFSSPSLWGSIIKGASTGSTIALAMRSVDRIVPLVVLGLALLMGSGVTAIRLRSPGLGLAACAACVALVAADLPPMWTGNMVASNLDRPETLPTYWTDAAAYLNAQGSSSRVLGLPGEDFAAYSFGVTIDQIAPGLLDRSYVQRQVQPTGTPAAANLVEALDEPIQQGTLDMDALAPVARLMSVGQILLQSDLQYERYHLPLPQALWEKLDPPPVGLSDPTTFGAPDIAPTIRYPLNSEIRLGLPTGAAEPPALAVFNVSDPRALIRTESAEQPLVLAGDGQGIVEAAGAGLLNGDPAILYGATLTQNPTEFAQAMKAGATLVVTDTNPDAEYRWGSLQGNMGQVQQPGAPGLTSDPSDYALPVFPGETTADQTIALVTGIKSVQASQYGDSLSFTPEARPIFAFDGNTKTAWTFGAHEAVHNVKLQVDLDSPVTTDHINLVQAQLLGGLKRRHITSVTLSFDGKDPITVPLDKASLGAGGQTVHFPTRTFSQLDIEVNEATLGKDKNYDGLGSVGFAEIRIPGVPAATESLRVPTDVLQKAGPASLQDPVDLLLQRERAIEPPRTDPEQFMSRTVDMPTARTFSLSGTAEINDGDSDYLINQLIGITPNGKLPAPEPASTAGDARVIAANSSTRLDTDRQARANEALDGNPATAWIAETGPQSGEWIDYNLSKPVTFDHLDLQEVNDGRHSLPSRITITTNTGSRTVDVAVPAVGKGRAEGSTTPVTVDFPAISGDFVKVTIDSVKQVTSLDYYSTFPGKQDILPVGIAELGIAGVTQPAPPAQIPAHCLSGLLTVDGKPIDVEITGTTLDALAGTQLSLEACGNSMSGITLHAGQNTIVTSSRLPSGWSIDQLWMGSAAGGNASAPLAAPSASATTAAAPSSAAAPASATAATTAASATTASPALQVTSQNSTSATVRVDGTGQGFWLVLGQSYSSGWSATLADGKSLGAPTLIDAYANGWYVPAGEINSPTTIHLEWTPQRVVWAAIGVSGVSIAATLLVAVWPDRLVFLRRLRRRRKVRPEPSVPNPPVGFGPLPASLSAFSARSGIRPSLRAALLAGVLWAIGSVIFTVPLIAVMAGGATVGACLWSRGRLAVRIVALLGLLAMPIYDVQQQWLHRYIPIISWPASVSGSNNIAWFALAMLGADLVAGLVRTRQAAPSTVKAGMETPD